MPILIFLRQYGLREYAVTFTVAALAGLGIAVMLNAAAGGEAGAPATLKTNPAVSATPAPTVAARVSKPVNSTRPARTAHVSRKHHRAGRHLSHPTGPAPAPQRSGTGAGQFDDSG
jgi:hypothetical protein